VAFNPQSLIKFGPTVQPGGIALFDSSVIPAPPELDDRVKAYGIPCTQVAMDLGKVMVKNVVALGALQAATELFPVESFAVTMEEALKDNCALLELNKQAFSLGIQAFKAAVNGKDEQQ
jgi:Pyruvate/2-oxoacid:ferredoxin oxidoreductase gamma subunit